MCLSPDRDTHTMFHVKHWIKSIKDVSRETPMLSPVCAFLFKITCQNSDIPRTPSTSCLGFVFFSRKFMILSPSIHSQHSIMNRLSTSQPGKFIQVPLFMFNIPHSRKLRCPAESSPSSLTYHKLFLRYQIKTIRKGVEDTFSDVSSTPMKLAASEFIEARV